MNIAIVGTGYVGLVSGTCFADTGVNVTCIDVDEEKIARLQRGEIPIYEPGLDEMVLKNVRAGRLKFSTCLPEVLNEQEIVFSAVGTPPDEDGSADLHYVLEVAKTIGENLNKYMVVVTKVLCLWARRPRCVLRFSRNSTAGEWTSSSMWQAIPNF